jgi:hypothetical protein
VVDKAVENPSSEGQVVVKFSVQDLTTPQLGQDHCCPPINGVPQNGQAVSDAGTTVAKRSFRDGSIGVRSKCQSTRTAAIGAPRRISQLPVTKSGGTDAAQNITERRTRTTKPTHLKERRVFGLSCGLRLQVVHSQRFQNPTGKIGIQKMCPTSKVRTRKALRAPPQKRQ